jgi:hypothetical protein
LLLEEVIEVDLQGCSAVVDFHLLDIGARAGADSLEG